MPGFALHHDRRRLDDARLSEHLTQPLGGRRKSQAANEELLCHDTPRTSLRAFEGTPWYAEAVPESWSGRRSGATNWTHATTRHIECRTRCEAEPIICPTPQS